MIALSSPILWYTSRAAGIVTFVLLTIVMVFGIMTATRVGNDQVPRFAVAELHRRLSLLAAVFVALHVLTTAIDSYVPTGFLSIILPGASSYKTIWVAFGTVAIDLMIAVIATSLLRQHLSHDAWRAIHWLSYLMWPVALVRRPGPEAHFGRGCSVLACVFPASFLPVCVCVYASPCYLACYRHPKAAIPAILFCL